MTLGPRSLTVRLIAGAGVLVTVVVLGIGSATYFALRSFLGDRLDEQLATTASQEFRRSYGPGGQRGPFKSPQDVWFAVLHQDGRPMRDGSYYGVNDLQLSDSQRAELIGSLKRPVTLTAADGQQLRVVAKPGYVDEIPAVGVFGLSTAEMDRTLSRLLGLELVIGAAALAVGLALTAFGVHRSLQPLRRVTRTAQEVTAELSPDGAGLDRRVPVSEPDTEVGQVAVAVNTLLGAVESQFAARLASEDRMRQFLADASHELRTPLTSIRGYAELDRLRRTKGLAGDGDTLDRIESEGRRMTRLVDDLLMLARNDQGGMLVIDDVEVASLVADAVAGARAAFPERRFVADVAPGLVVAGDRDQLLRVVRNVLDNAAVHASDPGEIRVHCWGDGGWAMLQVADPGPGLPPEEAAQVFERFWRADKARTRARGGSGLGLSIVASIVAAHGGTVRFHSDVDRGSIVTITLPASYLGGGGEAEVRHPAPGVERLEDVQRRLP